MSSAYFRPRCARVVALLAALCFLSSTGEKAYSQITVDTDNPYTFTTTPVAQNFILNAGWRVSANPGESFIASGTITSNAATPGVFDIPENSKLTWSPLMVGGTHLRYGFTKTGKGALEFLQTNPHVGNSSGETGYFTMEEGTLGVGSVNGFQVGHQGVGHYVQTGGTVNVWLSEVAAGNKWAGLTLANYYNNTPSTLRISGGELSMLGPGSHTGGTVPMTVGQRGKGYVYISGDAVVTMSGGFNISNATENTASEGYVYQSGGTVNVDHIRFGNGTSVASSYTLSGGVLNVNDITKGTATSAANNIFTMTGGVLNAKNINVDVTQTGGVLSPGGADDTGTTYINGDYFIGSKVAGLSPYNIALGGAATQAGSSGYPASNAFDGITATGSGNFSHTTAGETEHWLQVDLGSDVTVGGANIWYREGFGGLPGEPYANRITNAGSSFYFALYDENMTEVWASEKSYGYTQRPQAIDFSGEDNYGTGRYLRFVRDFGSMTDQQIKDLGGNETLNMTELEVFAYEPASSGKILMQLDVAGELNDILDFGGGGSLTIGEGAVLELAFLDGIGEAGDWQIFDNLGANSITGDFASISMLTPGWLVDTSELYTGGFVTISADPAAVPEPATWLMLISGIFGMLAMKRRGFKNRN